MTEETKTQLEEVPAEEQLEEEPEQGTPEGSSSNKLLDKLIVEAHERGRQDGLAQAEKQGKGIQRRRQQRASSGRSVEGGGGMLVAGVVGFVVLLVALLVVIIVMVSRSRSTTLEVVGDLAKKVESI